MGAPKGNSVNPTRCREPSYLRSREEATMGSQTTLGTAEILAQLGAEMKDTNGNPISQSVAEAAKDVAAIIKDAVASENLATAAPEKTAADVASEAGATVAPEKSAAELLEESKRERAENVRR